MQVYDSDGKIHGFEGEDKEELFKKLKDLEYNLLQIPKEGNLIQPVTIEKIIIAPMPKVGDILEANGLKFQITQELSKGRFVIRFIESFNPNK